MFRCKNASKAFFGHLDRFRREEDGAVIVLTLFLLVLMLILGGMAVDFMRFESRRAVLQGITDRAVLAAADLDQELDPADVVEDYFRISGYAGSLAGPPTVDDTDPTYREITARGQHELDTFFLKLIGMNTLTANAASTAMEGVGNIEISLVLDISGSMNRMIPGTAERRIDRLSSAASNFVESLLDERYEDRISISLVPYSEQVNAGPDLFNAVNVNQVHGFSHCIEFPNTAFTTAAWDDSTPLEQMQHYQFNPVYDVDDDGKVDEFIDTSAYSGVKRLPHLNQPVCPQQEFEAIVPISQDKDLLQGNIEDLHPRSGTTMFIGMKWGVAMLDPSFRSIYNSLPSDQRDTAFSARPASYDVPANGGGTNKYVVLMSDGQNDGSWRIYDHLYATPSMRAHWAYEAFNYYWASDLGWDSYRNWMGPKYSAGLGDTLLNNICTAAKDEGIIVYTIAMGTDPNASEDARGKAALRSCASGVNGVGFYHETSGAELDQIFQDIADQITDLRLTQ